MVTQIAIIQVNGSCLCIESDLLCYDAAVKRFRSFLPCFNITASAPVLDLQNSSQMKKALEKREIEKEQQCRNGAVTQLHL